MTTQEGRQQVDERTTRDRLIDEDAIIREAKSLAMAGPMSSPQVKLIRGLLTIINRLSRVDDPEYRHITWGLREGQQ